MHSVAPPFAVVRPYRSPRPLPKPALDRPAVVATATGLPPHRYTQRELAAYAVRIIAPKIRRGSTIERFFDRVGVSERHLALPIERYLELGGMQCRNDAWIVAATALAERTVASVLERAGVSAADVGMLMTTTVTGIAVPSIDARLMNLLPFAPSLKRVPLFGLGCLGGAAGLARASEYLRAFPDEAVILLSVELCSLTFQMNDESIANLVSTGLFGDGSAAVLLAGDRHPLVLKRNGGGRAANGGAFAGPRVVASRSVFFPNTERVMGWDVVDTGFKVVLSAEVPTIVRDHAREAVDAFLAEHGLARRDVARWILHPGGPKVIDALEEALELEPSALQRTRDGLQKYGNLSSASVLFLLDEHRADPPAPGSYAVLMAMGPAFCAEMVLLQW